MLRPLDLLVTAGQISDYIGALALLNGLPEVEWLLGDRGHNADWFRQAMKDTEVRACIPGSETAEDDDKHRY